VSDELVSLVKTVGKRDLPAIALATWGVYGGQYAAKVDVPYRGIASSICLAAMAIGALVLAARVIVSLRSGRGDR
jgi:hypothetical protein